ncbi:dihydrofolate reductase [Bacteroidota bacterium]
MIISLIAAVSENNVIGKNRGMPWNLPEDLKYFFRITKAHHVIMGRRTFHEFGVSKPLPDRINLIVSHQTDLKLHGTIVMNSIDQALEYSRIQGENEVFIIGGGTIYKQTIPFANKLYITRIHTIIQNGDTFFPEIEFNSWDLISEDRRKKDFENQYDFSFQVYKRK